MKKITLALLFALALAIAIFSLAPMKVLSDQEPEQEKKVETSLKEKMEIADAKTRAEIVESLVKAKAEQYNVSASQMLATIKCENKELDTKRQSGQYYKSDHPKWEVKAGDREKSFGLVMIHLPDHPEVSFSEATDPEFAVNFMADYFAKGYQKQWTCWRNLYN